MRKKLFVATLVLCFHVNQFYGQETAVKFAATITQEELREHLEVLASDEFEGRETGKAGQKKAAAYIADYYKSLGIEPSLNGSYFQQYPLVKQRLSASTMEVDRTSYKFGNDFYTFSDFGLTDVDLSAMVFTGYGIEDPKYSDYTGIDISGKVVMCLMGEPANSDGVFKITGTKEPSDWSGDIGNKIELAKVKGAKAILLINPNYKTSIPRIRYSMENPGLSLDYPKSVEEEELLPFFIISPELADKILGSGKMKTSQALKKKIDKKGRPATKNFTGKVKIHVKQEIENVTAENVLGFIEGTDPILKNELVVISAHYDHIGIVNGEINNGADDDGSGTVSALEIAEAFVESKKAGHGPRRSILILNVSGEEKGLLGSEWYSEYPVYPMENTVCDLNIDMIGRMDKEHEGNPNYVYIIGSDKLSTELHQVSEDCNDKYCKLDLDYTYNMPDDPNRFYYRSDHYNFAKKNIPVIFYFSGVHEDYHKPGDDVEKIMFDKMTTIAKLVFYTAWEVANRDEKLKLDVSSDLPND